MSSSRSSRSATRSSGRRGSQGAARRQKRDQSQAQDQEAVQDQEQGQDQEQDQDQKQSQSQGSSSRSSYSQKPQSVRTRELRRESEDEKYDRYIKEPVIGKPPRTDFERALEEEYGRFCREAVHIGGSYVDRGQFATALRAPWATRTLDQQRRMERLQQRFPEQPLRDVNLRPDCGQSYRFEGFDTSELLFYFLEQSAKPQWREYFERYYPQLRQLGVLQPQLPSDDERVPWRDEAQERRVRALLVEALNDWQQSKQRYPPARGRARSPRNSGSDGNSGSSSSSASGSASAAATNSGDGDGTRKSGRRSGRATRSRARNG